MNWIVVGNEVIKHRNIKKFRNFLVTFFLKISKKYNGPAIHLFCRIIVNAIFLFCGTLFPRIVYEYTVTCC